MNNMNSLFSLSGSIPLSEEKLTFVYIFKCAVLILITHLQVIVQILLIITLKFLMPFDKSFMLNTLYYETINTNYFSASSPVFQVKETNATFIYIQKVSF